MVAGDNNGEAAFSIRWQVLGFFILRHFIPIKLISDSPTCDPIPTPAIVPGPSDNWHLLEESRPLHITLPYFEWEVRNFCDVSFLMFQFLRFYASTPCSDFAISARIYDHQVIGNPDLYVSTTNPEPMYDFAASRIRAYFSATEHMWSAQTLHNDFLALRNVCNPTSTENVVFYIAIHAKFGSNFVTEVVATAINTFITRPIAALPPQQLHRTLSRTLFSCLISLTSTLGSMVEITCAVGLSVHVYSCEKSGTPGCTENVPFIRSREPPHFLTVRELAAYLSSPSLQLTIRSFPITSNLLIGVWRFLTSSLHSLCTFSIFSSLHYLISDLQKFQRAHTMMLTDSNTPSSLTSVNTTAIRASLITTDTIGQRVR